ncbi:conserved hypothetical protein [Culex quinquefasciatus]|uniref:Uncharacterized protein n=1 Tax=Culex quinquefasciatus TaxID=7176 RepID=B0WN20_CULQU|nr:conserved hypothetical protein [Culex quinquefasciatus]|eukprot:XP_001850104.1 conserved hypothetical protein [Culex quinquefasciatus]
MPSSQGYQKVASDPSEAELVQRTAAGEEMPSIQQPDTAVTANPAGKIPATNSQQRLMPADSDSVSSSLDEGDPEAPPGGGRLEDDEVTVASTTQVSATAWFTVGVLCFVNLINYMDRFTIADFEPDFHHHNSRPLTDGKRIWKTGSVDAPLF